MSPLELKSNGKPVVYYKRMSPAAIAPSRGNIEDAGTDLFGISDVKITPGEVVCIRTGIHIALPPRTSMQFVGKSGRAWKGGDPAGEGGQPIGMTVLAGLIDAGYRGELKIIAGNINFRGDGIHIPYGSASCQMVMSASGHGLVFPTLIELEPAEFDNLPATVRGSNGFGSTDRTR